MKSSNQSLHRKLAEKCLGRKLHNNEVVHHINHNSEDNRIGNLRVMKRKDHSFLHAKKKRKLKRMNLYLKWKQIESLNNIDDLSASEHIRRAVDEYLKRKEPKLIRSPSK